MSKASVVVVVVVTPVLFRPWTWTELIEDRQTDRQTESERMKKKRRAEIINQAAGNSFTNRQRRSTQRDGTALH